MCAALVKKHPARFSGLATLPTANVAWAADELQRAHQELGLIGATLPLDAFVSLAGARALAPIFAVAQKNRSHIFVHRGAASAEIPGHQPEAGASIRTSASRARWPANPASTAVPGDNASARTLLDHRHASGHRRHHAGAHRLSRRLSGRDRAGGDDGRRDFVRRRADSDGRGGSRHGPFRRNDFSSVYLDTGQSGRGPRGIALAAKVFGADRILFGTDSGPTDSIAPTMASVKQAALTTEEKQQILFGNGRRLMEAKGVKI